MSNNEVEFERDISSAIEHAKSVGRFDLSDYLSLRSSNDAIRESARKWLFDSVLEIVFAFNNHGASIKIDQKAKHRIRYSGGWLSGELLELRQGLRCLTIEAGWTQSLEDGFMRGGALAFARLNHFGHSKQNEELVLLTFEGNHQWFSIEDEKHRRSFEFVSLKPHFQVLMG
ncbi:MAG: hypothetical protein R2684_09975 [Pyrinomonadaceae bacterium]